MKKSEKKSMQKQINDNMLTNLNDFMKEFNIDSINFGKTHSIKKTSGKKAKDTVKKRK